MTATLKNRYEFVLFFDVENGNPNGDPDAGNMPRIDPQTGKGIVSDVCIKRKVRNYVSAVHDNTFGNDIYVSEGAVLNNKHKEAYDTLGLEGKQDKKDDKAKAQGYMCKRYFDVRTFGAVMDTGDYKCGQICGPIQFCFSKSEDVILQQEITITRMASTTEKEKDSENRTMGRKYLVPYALYRMEGFVSAKLAERTQFTEEDLQLLWEALVNMFEHDRSASRGKMATRKLFVFKHESPLGNAPAIQAFSTIRVKRNNMDAPPRSFEDYTISFNRENLPETVAMIEVV